MKIVELGNGAVAFEPDAYVDRFGEFTVSRLANAGLNKQAIDLCARFAGIKTTDQDCGDTLTAGIFDAERF
jgi:hypothetical protein